MTSPSFNLKVVTPTEVFFEGPAVSVIAPGGVGYFGVLKNHAPLVATIGRGDLTFRNEEGKTERFNIEGGFFEVVDNKVLVLTDKILRS